MQIKQYKCAQLIKHLPAASTQQAGSVLPVAVAGVRLGFQQQLFDIFRGVQVVNFGSLPPLQPADT